MASTKVNLTTDDGETDHGTLEMPFDLMAQERSRYVITTRDDSITIEFSGGVSLHIFQSED